MLNHTLQDIRKTLTAPPPTVDTQVQLQDSAQAQEEADEAKSVADAAVTQARAELDLPGVDRAAKQAALNQAAAQQAQAASEAAQRHRDHSARASEATQLSLAHAAIFREARARLHWVGSYGAVIAFSIGTILGAGWIWGMAIDDHLNPSGKTVRRPRLKAVVGLLLLLAVSVIVIFLVWTLGFIFLKYTVFRGMGLPGPFDLNLLRFDDATTTFIFGAASHVGGVFFPGGIDLVSGASLLVTLAVAALGAAVGATLYQTPWQVAAWQASLATPTTDTRPYERFLTRCFQRLNVCIYVGATLMVVCVVHLNAQYSWVAALLDPSASTEPWKTALPTAIANLADEFAFQYGLAFTTVLTGLFLPSWVILRRRAWVVARAQNLQDPTNKSAQAWLEDHGMRFTSIQQYSQVLALLAPAGAGIFVPILKALSGVVEKGLLF